MEDIIVPIAFFGTCAFLIWMSANIKMKRSQMEHEERMLAMEKGIPLPVRPVDKVRNPYKWPIVLIAVGVAMLIGMIYDGNDSWAWGFLPLLTGIGMIISHRYMQRDRKSQPGDWLTPPTPPTPPPPPPSSSSES